MYFRRFVELFSAQELPLILMHLNTLPKDSKLLNVLD